MGASTSQVTRPSVAPSALQEDEAEGVTDVSSLKYPSWLYFVSGEPKLKYTLDPNHGPLIFHLDEAGIYKADSNFVLCYPIVGSIPTKQGMEVRLLEVSSDKSATETRPFSAGEGNEQKAKEESIRSGSSRGAIPHRDDQPNEHRGDGNTRASGKVSGSGPSMGVEERMKNIPTSSPLTPSLSRASPSSFPSRRCLAQVTFDVSASRFIHRLSVYVGVEVAFVKSKGVVLSFNDHPALKSQHCVLDVYRALGGMYTTRPFPLWALEPPGWKALSSVGCRTETLVRGRLPDVPREKQQVICSAPIVIALYMVDEHGTDPSKTASILQRSRELARGLERDSSYGGDVCSSAVLPPSALLPCYSPLMGSNQQSGSKTSNTNTNSVGGGALLASAPRSGTSFTGHTQSITNSEEEQDNNSRSSSCKRGGGKPSFTGWRQGASTSRRNSIPKGRPIRHDSVFSSVCEFDGKGAEPSPEGVEVGMMAGGEGRQREEQSKVRRSGGFSSISGEINPPGEQPHICRSFQQSNFRGLLRDEEIQRRRKVSPKQERYSCMQYTFLQLPPAAESNACIRIGKENHPKSSGTASALINPLSLMDSHFSFQGIEEAKEEHPPPPPPLHHANSDNAKNPSGTKHPGVGGGIGVAASAKKEEETTTTPAAPTTTAPPFSFSSSPALYGAPTMVNNPSSPSNKHSEVESTLKGILPENSGEYVLSEERVFTWDRAIVQQVLQVGPEVYLLEDVFDVGHRDAPARSAIASSRKEVSPRRSKVMMEGENEGESDSRGAEAEDDDDHEDDTEKDEEEDEDYLCVVCLVAPKDTAMLPCRHMCCCQQCARRVCLSNNKCPICRADVETTLKCTF